MKQKEADVNNKLQLYGIFQGKLGTRKLEARTSR